MELFCEAKSSSDRLLHQLDDDLLGSVAAAVAEGQAYYIDNAASSLPNHHIVDALIEMAKAVYPDEYASLE